MLSTQPALQKLEMQLDSVIEKEMFVNGKQADEIREMRERECNDVLIDGETREKVNLETLEIKFEAENGGQRISFPSNLSQQMEGDCTLKGTELLGGLTKSFRDIVNPIVKERLMKEESKLEEELERLGKQSQSVDATIANLLAHFDNLVIIEAPNPDVRKRLRRDIGEVVIGGGNKVELETKLTTILTSILGEALEYELLVRNSKAAGAWEIVNNQRGKIGETMVLKAVDQLMDQFLGMTVMKSHLTPSAELLKGLRLEMNGENPQTGKKEHGLIFTWLEEDVLVINMVQTKMLEEKPWRMENQETATEEVKYCLNQLLRDLKTFKELFPDFTDIDMKCIRWVVIHHVPFSHLTLFSFQYIVALPNVSSTDWPFQDASKHIILRGDFHFRNSHKLLFR